MKLVTLASISFALAACGKGDHHAPRGSASDEAAPERAAKQPLTAGFFGKKVAALGPLAKLSNGMTQAAAKQAAPEFFADPKHKDPYYQSVDDPAVEHVSYSILFDHDTNKVIDMSISLPASATAMLASAWGPGKAGKDSIGKPRTFWFDPASGWRAYLEPGFSDEVKLSVSRYAPVDKFLGDGPDTLGFAPQGILGATVADLRARFADTLIEEDAAHAAAEQKQVSAMAGTDVSKVVGEAKPEVRLDQLPTDWAEFWTRVQIDWTDDGKVEDVRFDLPYEAFPAAHDEILAAIEKKWGAPKDGEYLGEKSMFFRTQAPFVVVRDDTITHAWDVRVSAVKLED